VADQVEAFAVMACRRDDLDRVGYQLVECIVRKIGRIGPRARE